MIAYYQTVYQMDPKPLVGAVSDIIVGAIHLNDDRSLHVNDSSADNPEFVGMWQDMYAMRGDVVRGSSRNRRGISAEEWRGYQPQSLPGSDHFRSGA